MEIAYYNEVDPYCVEWLKVLISRGLVAPGDVDDRPIQEVSADDVKGYRQCHWFAGIGGWSYALRLAGWPDEKEVWTGSCPCQPFSGAGQGRGENDPRHLWPFFRSLIAERHPAKAFGEQVASKAGRVWLSGVRSDMEELGYAFGAADLCAPCVGEEVQVEILDERGEVIYAYWEIAGPPHIRQRLWWVADPQDSDRGRLGLPEYSGRGPSETGGFSATRRVGHSDQKRLQRRGINLGEYPNQRSARETGISLRMEYPNLSLVDRGTPSGKQPLHNIRGATNAWSDFEILPCLDGRSRRTQSGLFPLAHGVSQRMGKLRAYGNSIVPQVAAEFIRASCDF
jgi:DNA (cytosine-5)-methyltransferase 1